MASISHWRALGSYAIGECVCACVCMWCVCVHVCVCVCVCVCLSVCMYVCMYVRHPAVTGVYCIVRDSRSGCSNDFKCMYVCMYVCMYRLQRHV